MPAPLTAEKIERIRELGMLGWSTRKIAQEVGISRWAAGKYAPRPADEASARHNMHGLVDDWGHPVDWLLAYPPEPVDQYPDDLPTLELDEFQWTQQELDDAIEFAHQILDLQERGVQWDARFI